MKDIKDRQLKKKLARVFRQLQGGKSARPADLAKSRDFVFHMADWQKDLELLAKLYRSPGRYDDAIWKRGVNGFLLHVIGHLLEACRLYGLVSDPFDVLRKLPRNGHSRAVKKSHRAKEAPHGNRI
jgi:hypothetical protein